MDGLVSAVGEYQTAIKSVGAAVISLVALTFIAFHVIKAIAASKQSKMNAIAKHVVMCAIITLLALMGIAGTVTLVNKMAPNDSILPRDGGVDLGMTSVSQLSHITSQS